MKSKKVRETGRRMDSRQSRADADLVKRSSKDLFAIRDYIVEPSTG